MRAMPTDIALAWDASSRRFDVAVTNGDLVLDATPLTPMALAVLQDRRARSDDTLPAEAIDPAAPPSLRLRRGTALDAVTVTPAGSRLWLLQRAKASEATRLLAVEAAGESLADIGATYARTVTIEAAYGPADRLNLTCRLGDSVLTVQRRMA